MTRTVLTSLSLATMLSVAASGATAQGNQVPVETLTLQNEGSYLRVWFS